MQTNKRKFPCKRYISAIVAAGLVTVYIIFDKKLFNQTELSEIYRILCDGFFVPGIIFACFGALIEISNQGFFDIIGYSTRLLVDAFSRNKNFRSECHSYFDYTQLKAAGRKTKGSTSFIFFTGLIFIAVGLVFNVLFYQVYVQI